MKYRLDFGTYDTYTLDYRLRRAFFWVLSVGLVGVLAVVVREIMR